MSNKNETSGNFMLELNDRLEGLVDLLMPIRAFLVYFTSLFTVILSFILSFWIRHNFSFPPDESVFIPRVLLLVVIVKMVVFFFFKLYEGVWRYVSISDISKIFWANLLSSLLLVAGLYLFRSEYAPGFSLNVFPIDFLLCLFAMSGKRVVARIIRESASEAMGQKDIRTILVGTTDGLNQLIQALSAVPSKRRVIGVLSDEIKVGQSIRGISVLGKTKSAAKCAKKHNASEILLLPPFSTPANIKVILNDLESRDKACDLRMIPSYMDIANGDINVSHIKEVEIEDLLGRQPVQLDRSEVADFVKGKNIMVTGAGGSIGSELCHQLASYHPAKLVLFELSEYNLYEITNCLHNSHPEVPIVSIIGDVRTEKDIEEAITRNGVSMIYHAAAYKHVPLMEANPLMAIRTNVAGTDNLAKVAEKCGIDRVVVISTDKAVNPTSIMGASKRISERLVLERPAHKTEFVVVRFGNVLGSSGSVIPRFKQQLKDGGPLTVTSKEVVRYFMSIPEAVDLLLQAGAIGDDRDIMVLEMGEPIKIYDMARKLIELSGLEPDVDIDIQITGLRPGEKEYEELLTEEEKVDRTPYDRIYVAKKQQTKAPDVSLKRLLEVENEIGELKKVLSELIPENKFDEGS